MEAMAVDARQWMSILLFVATALMLVVAAISYRKRQLPVARTMILVMLAAAFYALGYAFEILSPGLRGVKLSLQLQYLGIPFVTALWLLLIIQFTGVSARLRSRLTFPVHHPRLNLHSPSHERLAPSRLFGLHTEYGCIGFRVYDRQGTLVYRAFDLQLLHSGMRHVGDYPDVLEDVAPSAETGHRADPRGGRSGIVQHRLYFHAKYRFHSVRLRRIGRRLLMGHIPV